MTILLCGDVMTGRGVDQLLSHPSDPRLFEPSIGDARAYVELAEARSGPIPRAVDPTYIWGDALGEMRRAAPEALVVNLETAVTRSDEYWPGKGINYRMHPANVGCLAAAGIDVCVLANNHVLDWGHAGLRETLATLRRAGIETAGAGRSLAEAAAPAAVALTGGARLQVFALGCESSGIPPIWAATEDRPGVFFLGALSEAAAAGVAARMERAKHSGDLLVASIHWGSNWGYGLPEPYVRFAHRLIDGGVDIVHGHSSHHARPVEVYRDRLILYGCGDFIDDYEGIGGYEEFRTDLRLMYFVTVDIASGALVRLRVVPMHVEKLRLTRASDADTAWLRDALARISAQFGSHFALGPDGSLDLLWDGPS